MDLKPPNRYRVRPSPERSAWGLVGSVVGLGISLILARVAFPLGIIGIALSLASAFFYATNLFGKRGIASEVIEVDQPPAPPAAAAPKTPAERLAMLEELREKGLIDVTEYQRKRREIIEGV